MTKYRNLYHKVFSNREYFEDLFNGSLDGVPTKLVGQEATMTRGDVLDLLTIDASQEFQGRLKAEYITDQLIARKITTTDTAVPFTKREGTIAKTVGELEAFPEDFTQRSQFLVRHYKKGQAISISREAIVDVRTDIMMMEIESAYDSVAKKIDLDTIRCIQSSAPGGDNNPSWGSYTIGQNSDSLYHPDAEYYGLNQSTYSDKHVVDAGGSLSTKPIKEALKLLNRHTYSPDIMLVHTYQIDELMDFDAFKDLNETFQATPDMLNQYMRQGYIGSIYGVRILTNPSVIPGLVTIIDTSRAAVYVEREPIQLERDYIMRQQIAQSQVFERGAPAVIDGNAIAQIYNCGSTT